MDPLFTDLNPEQLKAVKTLEGPILVLAGAGSGKTRVITSRIASMLKQGIPQKAILAVTFTNKAAREMAGRIQDLCGARLRNLTVSTFHAFGVRILRAWGDRLGYRHNFSIYDQADQQSLLKESARDARMDVDLVRANALFSRIKTGQSQWESWNEELKPLYKEYQQRLKLFNAVDFDDLIVKPIDLFGEHSEVLDQYHQRYRYLMVDEFQDTSAVQYTLIQLLARNSGNLCVVGDDDQSIYSWRGARFQNILQFEQDFPGCLEIKLERNYRSTEKILLAANSVIARNQNRKIKQLWSKAGGGESIQLCFPENEKQEGESIANTIRTLAWKHHLRFSDFAVLVRTNSLTRPLEESFLQQHLRYQVSGGMSFFQRKEVKDIVSYLRTMANSEDDINLLRIINTPRRGLGKKALEIITETAEKRSCSLYSAMEVLRTAEDFTHPVKSVLDEFLSLMEAYRTRFLTGKKMAASLRSLIEEINYWTYLVHEYPQGNTAQWKNDNVESLIDSLSAYETDPDVIEPGFFQYLNRISLNNQEDTEILDESKVNILTIHSAKGLEFDTVFIAGVEQDIIPHIRALEDQETNIEEERRLFYVALTRAKKRLYLSACRTRTFRGSSIDCTPSPFIEELPKELLDIQQEEEELSTEEAQRLFQDMKKKYS